MGFARGSQYRFRQSAVQLSLSKKPGPGAATGCNARSWSLTAAPGPGFLERGFQRDKSLWQGHGGGAPTLWASHSRASFAVDFEAGVVQQFLPLGFRQRLQQPQPFRLERGVRVPVFQPDTVCWATLQRTASSACVNSSRSNHLTSPPIRDLLFPYEWVMIKPSGGLFGIENRAGFWDSRRPGFQSASLRPMRRA